MMFRKLFMLLFAASAVCVAEAQVKEEKYYRDIYPDTWVATDDVGRVMPTSDDAPLKSDKERTVGIFYVTWHTQNLHSGKLQ